jgi:hypothetical protein
LSASAGLLATTGLNPKRLTTSDSKTLLDLSSSTIKTFAEFLINRHIGYLDAKFDRAEV